MQTKLVKQTLANTDFEVRSLDNLEAAQPKKESIFSYLKYLLMGLFFGVILVKSEVISWYRIQEMFRLQSFHMFGVIGSAVVTGIISIWLIKKFKIKTISGQQIELPAKEFQKGQIYGGLIFGFGWAIAGWCPGPAIASLGVSPSRAGIFVLAMLVGSYGTKWIDHRSKRMA